MKTHYFARKRCFVFCAFFWVTACGKQEPAFDTDVQKSVALSVEDSGTTENLESSDPDNANATEANSEFGSESTGTSGMETIINENIGDEEFLDDSINENSTDVTSGEINLCAKNFSVSKKKIVIAGKSNSEQRKLSQTDVVAIKLTGNKASLDLEIAGKKGDTLHGLCLFLAGNQTFARIDNFINIRGLVYYGRGNQSTGRINVHSGGNVENSYVNLRGNGASFAISGDGNFNCPVVDVKGNAAEVDCK